MTGIKRTAGFVSNEQPIAISLAFILGCVFLSVRETVQQGIQNSFTAQEIFGAVVVRTGFGLLVGLGISAFVLVSVFVFFWAAALGSLAFNSLLDRIQKK